MRTHYRWQLGSRSLDLGGRTLIMGIVNVTPDSFSDGGLHTTAPTAVEHALRLLDDGADILDIGGESTRPGASVLPNGEPSGLAGAVTAEQEMDRVIPVIKGVLRARPDAVLSVDTYKAKVAKAAVESGAEILNDISGFGWDPDMRSTVAELRCGAVLMHVRGRPEEWRSLPPLVDPVEQVRRELKASVEAALDAGVAHQRLVLDPGLGFGKSFDENYPLLARLDAIAQLGFPLLSAPSRKSFLGRTAGLRLAELGIAEGDLPPTARLHPTMAAVVASVLSGAHIVRVHDVRPAVEAVAVADAVSNAVDQTC